MPRVDIRRGETGEAKLIAEFARRTFQIANGHEMDDDALSRHLNDLMSDELFVQMFDIDTFYLASASNQLLGYAQLGPVDLKYASHVPDFDDSAFELRRLYVDPTSQGGGIGSDLILRIIADPRSKACSTLYITTWESNLGAQRLYERSGFRKVAEMPDFSIEGNLEGYEHILEMRL
jgi:ribosomal protein S18 acetylase RimI-like enzyme